METLYSMGMETLYPESYIWSSNWTIEENKKFERALAIYDKETPDRWLRVADMIPGKSVIDVYRQYRELEDDVSNIEAGLVPVPGYLTPSFTLEWVDNRGFDALKKRSSMTRPSDHERKKGVPWTEDEHRRFLLGLLKHGKGDWRDISRNFVVSKTPTQVASHAQKYYNRQNSGMKEKRRPSIHDITTVNLTEMTPLDSNKPHSLDHSTTMLPQQQMTTNSTKNTVLDWNDQNDGAVMVFNGDHGNLFMPSSYEMASHGLKLQGQNLYAFGHHGAHNGSFKSMFPVQSTRYQIRG